MWTSESRAKYDRDKLRYPSDVTDEEWAHVVPLIPPAKRGGRKREANMREVFNGIMYVLSMGCQWRYIPKDLPPKSTVYRYYCDWSWGGVLDRIHDALYEKCREQAERETSPTAATFIRTATRLAAFDAVWPVSFSRETVRQQRLSRADLPARSPPFCLA
jgi:putative transposase